MKIIYIAKHNQINSNDDEGSIRHALETLGHEVICYNERDKATCRAASRESCDFYLFHKWDDIKAIRRMRRPGVFWYFDLVDWPDDKELETRNNGRKNWMRNMVPHVQLGFCTDGDWVAKDDTGKLVHLMQGADQRRGPGDYNLASTPIIFTGNPHGGTQRMSCIQELEKRFKKKFSIVEGKHGQQLADVFASALVCIAPDAPVTDVYWSNRVYLTLGMRGFLLHPYAKLLAEQYESDRELVFYRDREELVDRIYFFLSHPYEREMIREAGYRKTLEQHTYLHRVEELLRIVKERIL